MKTNQKPLSIYIHIPFCVRKCLYCDFLSAPAGEQEQEQYLRALLEEIGREAAAYEQYEVQTVFIGGGTPSLFSENWIEQILKTVYDCFHIAKEPEITMEVNPGTVTRVKLEGYKKAGVNRLSIGLQSAQEEELKLLGRVHTAKDFLVTYDNAIKSGFNNINIDLMSAIPGQSLESYQDTLNQVLSLKPAPTHISAYSLIIEEGTPFYEQKAQLQLPDEETDRILYKITNDILGRNGYHRYEISNYAKEGYECRHNKVYWLRGDYIGFGIGAASLVQNVRWSNIGDVEAYSKRQNEPLNIKEQVDTLSLEEQMEEYMFLGLRLIEGISEENFYQTFGRKLREVYPGIVERLEKQGLLICRKEKEGETGRIALSEFGLDVSNIVMAEFLL